MSIVTFDNKQKALISDGEFLLECFHKAYEKSHFGPETEYWRGQFTCWRRLVEMFYGARIAAEMIETCSQNKRLSIPHGGLLAGDGYLGHDSGSHPFIGKLPAVTKQ